MKEALYNFYGYNQELFLLINHLANHTFLRNLLSIISAAFNIYTFPFYCLISCGLGYTKLKYMAANSRKLYYNKITDSLSWAILTYALLVIVYTILKFTVNLPRPYCSLPYEWLAGSLDIGNQRCLSSFPSSHAALSLMLAFFLWPYLKTLVKILAVAIVVSVAIARIALNMHYPADILYGYLIISFLIFMVQRFQLTRLNKLRFIYQLIYNYLFYQN